MLEYAMRTSYYTRIFFAVLSLMLLAADGMAASADSWQVLKILDGDSIVAAKLRHSERRAGQEEVRLIGIDAPEIGQKPWGVSAKRHLHALLKKHSGRIALEFDVQQRDRYGRLLAYIWTADGILINERMVADGYALAYTIAPNVKYAERIASAQKRARRSSAGLWKSHAFDKAPQEWRKAHPR